MFTDRLKVLNRIKEQIQEAERYLKDYIQTYEIDKEQLEDKNYSESEKQEILNDIRKKYLNTATETKSMYLNAIQKIYDEEIQKLNDVIKELNNDKVSIIKQFTNTDYLYLDKEYNLLKAFELL